LLPAGTGETTCGARVDNGLVCGGGSTIGMTGLTLGGKGVVARENSMVMAIGCSNW
jgi:hypothetical protein